MQLLIPGNPNLETLKSVLVVSQRHYAARARKILLLDNEKSMFGAGGRDLRLERSELIGRCTDPGTVLTSVTVSTDNLSTRLPELIATELSSGTNGPLVIDLTNGHKSVTALLYAAGSLLKVDRLFYLSVRENARGRDPVDFQPDDYSVEILDRIGNMKELSRRGFFDLVYYRDFVDELRASFTDTRAIAFSAIPAALQEIDEGVREYFHEHFVSSILHCGRAVETIAFELCKSWKSGHRGSITRSEPRQFSEAIAFLRIELCEWLRSSQLSLLPPNDWRLAWVRLRNVDSLLEIVRVRRNDAAHAHPHSLGAADAKLVIDSTITLFDSLPPAAT